MTLRLLAVAAFFLPGAALAQVPTAKPRQPTTAADTGETRQPERPPLAVPAPGGNATDTSRVDSAATDTTGAQKELVQWAEEDSVMKTLLARPGYITTRYQGKRAVFDANQKVIELSGNSAVKREEATLVADTIVYNDQTKLVRAAAAPKDTIVLRDPTQGEADLVALGGMEYDLIARRGVVRDLSTSSSQLGQTWYVHGDRAAVVADSDGDRGSTSYAEDGSITSCNLTYPHYHFQAKEIKMVSKTLLVARPAVLYISDIPVMWLPFIFQDMRSGRRSGIIPPRFGISDIVRASPRYSRSIENLGYYFAISDYMDATISFDWRSGNGNTDGDLGWARYNGQWRYRWLDRFLSGDVRASYSSFSEGNSAFNLSWSHQQQFSRKSSLNASINYSSNTTAIQRQAFTAAQTLAAIASTVAFQQAVGPMNISIGGSQTQHTGRKDVNRNFPNLSVTTPPVNITDWLLWSPQLSINNQENLDREVPFAQFTPSPTNPAGYDSTGVTGDDRNTTLSFQTPLRIFGFNWQNSIQVTDHEQKFPQPIQLIDVATGDSIGSRVFARTYETEIDWTTGISLPALMQRTLKITPSISIVNADPSLPFMARTTFTGGSYVRQSKTLQYGISMSPTLFGFFPGFGPFSRLRHSIQPQISFGYSPATQSSTDLLRAFNRSRAGNNANMAHSTVTLRLNQVFEAKLKRSADTATTPGGGEKVKLLTINFSPITYDFERAKAGLNGITSTSFNYRLASDLLPGFDFSVNYSLYQGNVYSDSARFKPFRTGISASMTIGRDNNPFAVLSRIFGNPTTKADTVVDTAPANERQDQQGIAGGLNERPNIAGPSSSRNPMGIDASAGWTATLQFSSTRSRPIPGATVFDPRAFCQQYINFPATYNQCINSPIPVDTLPNRYGGSQAVVLPSLATLRGNLAFNLTPKWAMRWTTGYDFQRHEFSDQELVLQRDMHDWRANLAFSRAPTGNFMFSFYISLKAEPDLKFDFRRSTSRCSGEDCGVFLPLQSP
ncbi:MAG TPA: putative LPS assembly protein LptD [Gemmatimonadaceae bacterium]|nr:putative LPS assembly protein LptD [Gemmatimonadaceae bacterium]